MVTTWIRLLVYILTSISILWAEHIKIISNKIAKNIGIIRKIAHLLPTKILINSYYTLVNPYFIYGNIVWASNYDSRIKNLVLLQKRIIRIIARDKYYDHTHKRFIELGIMKFENINTYMTGLFTYKAIFK